ncbi:nucleoside-triphosphate diphosphatase [Streptococcus mutans]|uniref:nucleoside-triphosphate diphosphatase n=1 Tax=Streptococcus mutans TaxID=1309 RepID=UPI0002B55F87|nr:nucleoside-triphosphate diphosphatase [Streptococcus mutans]EMC04351.1 putative deoxyribonucleotide triphosphate pyrophosphatase/unknown domain fusion protein [Streptococcus mutans NFSM1]NLQ90056.1 nucleoside-triphosphate diphosphatase [Streptococcus mutans]
MKEKIYEYKDDHNWFISQWSKVGSSTYYEEEAEETYSSIEQSLRGLLDEGNSFILTVIKINSSIALVRFILKMLNEEQQDNFKVSSHKGAILVTQGQQLLLVCLPKKGITITDFFEKEKKVSELGDTILIATRNEGKTKEFSQMFAQLGIKVENLNQYPDLPEVEETGLTFEENARLKAETISHLTGQMVLADDSGLKVDVLGGLPGIWSARFSGPDATDQSNNAKLLHELAMVFDIKDRSAQFHTTLVVAVPDKESLVVEADWSGYIDFAPKGNNGFGYDPLFLVGETGKTAAELSNHEKNIISHRGQAVKKLMEVFPAWQNAH